MYLRFWTMGWHMFERHFSNDRTALDYEQHWTTDSICNIAWAGEEARPLSRSRRTLYKSLTARHFRSHGLGLGPGIRESWLSQGGCNN